MNFSLTSQTGAALARGIARPAKSSVHARDRKIHVPRGGKMEGSVVREKIAKHGMRNSNVLATPEMQGASARSNLNRRDRRAWDQGLKTTYYLRTLQASNAEKSTIDVKKEIRGLMAAIGGTEPKTQKNACSIDAMLNGGTCEDCQ